MLLIVDAVKGKTVAMSKDSCRCPGAAHGFGLDKHTAEDFPGGREAFLRFLSVGNEQCQEGRAVIEQLKKAGAPTIMITEFSEGEGFCKNPELVQDFLDGMPDLIPEGPYIILKPLKDLAAGDSPKVVSFLANPDQLSALVVLANDARKGSDTVRIPFGAGCHCFGLYPFDEANKAEQDQHAVIGLTDISARFYVGKPLGRDILSFTVPWKMYEEMEANADESFLTRFAWKTMMGR
jgi:hypothetical protein